MTSSYARLYAFSDTYGGNSNSDGTPHSIIQRPDWDARLETDFASADVFNGVQEKENIRGLPIEYLRHIVSLAVRLQETAGAASGRTGIFINRAPRTDGPTARFHVVDVLREPNADSLLRVVTTNLDVLSEVRDAVARVRVLPLVDNGLHPNGDQFRSRVAPSLLNEHVCARVKLEEQGVEDIPTPEDGWKISWIDTFGNVVTLPRGSSAVRSAAECLERIGDTITINVGQSRSVKLQVARNLESAQAGECSIYRNGGVDIVRKWGWGNNHPRLPDETEATHVQQSAYFTLSEPHLGDNVCIID
ncbi:hypothetical protein KBD59_00935 [Candidatus Gracilibacteria bacterium]|nr:hypothetical protein [Candidatus Gracilibacteria bacterium]